VLVVRKAKEPTLTAQANAPDLKAPLKRDVPTNPKRQAAEVEKTKESGFPDPGAVPKLIPPKREDSAGLPEIPPASAETPLPTLQRVVVPSLPPEPPAKGDLPRLPSQLPVKPSPPVNTPKVGFEIGNLAREIKGKDIFGKPFKLSDYRGKVVVLDFWGNW
jgi:hypothetical protein